MSIKTEFEVGDLVNVIVHLDAPIGVPVLSPQTHSNLYAELHRLESRKEHGGMIVKKYKVCRPLDHRLLPNFEKFWVYHILLSDYVIRLDDREFGPTKAWRVTESSSEE